MSLSSLLSFVPLALQVQRVEPTTAEVSIEAKPRRSSASCPACGSCSVRIHSRYGRTLRDLPWQGRPVTIQVAVRRFRCANIACVRKTFSERLGDVAAISARRTGRLADLQRHLALALGGEAGARLAGRIAIPTSADTLLRMVTTISDETEPPEPRVIAVDDWAWRRGHSYGTILVDLEHNQVIDLLPDRQAETLATWLRKHPSIEIVARDRAGAYADGVRQGAPQAIQVADRWHMLRNLGDAVRAVVDRQHRAIQRVSKEISEERTAASAAMTVASATVAKPSAAAQRSQDAYARRQARYEEAARLKEAGVSLSRIAALMGAERKTIRSWLRSGGATRWRKPPRVGVLTPYLDVLGRRWSEGCRNAALLWRELMTLGFSGRPGIVRSWAGQQRKSEPTAAANSSEQATPASFQSTREVARLLMIDPAGLSQPERTFVSRVLAQVPGLTDSIAVAKRLNKLLRRKSTEDLEGVLDAAAETGLAGFAAGLRRDIEAVQASFDLPWTTSPAEGQINRLKMLKRTMYGRAGFALLRARVLNAA